MRRVLAWVIVFSALLPASCSTGLAQTENQAADARKVVVESFVISGTRAVDSAELAEITNSISGSTFNDDAEELRGRIRSEFKTTDTSRRRSKNWTSKSLTRWPLQNRSDSRLRSAKVRFADCPRLTSRVIML
jgi:hypothetical protein